MFKIFYNNNNYICNIPPNFLPIEDEEQYIEIEDERKYYSLFSCAPHYCWKIQDDEFIQIRYENDTEEEKLSQLRSQRADILKAFDIYKSNVQYGIIYETEYQHTQIISWYEDLLNLIPSAFENIPYEINTIYQKL